MVATNNFSQLFLWSLVLLVVVLVGFVLASHARRKLRPPEQTPEPGFSLEDLRELHRTGQLTEEEYQRARHKMASSLRQSALRPDNQKKP